MLDLPLDAWYAWLGLSLAGVVLVGAASGLPTVPPPDAEAAAATVDRAAVSEYASTAEHPLDATTVRLRPRRLALRNDAGTAHAAFAFGPVTPVPPGNSRLRDVVHGAHPSDVYDDSEAFRQAVVDARARGSDAPWRAVDRTLLVRTTTWEGVDVVLVDA
jgi:hypothetical protein